jgi:hypothetical protein
MKIPCLPVQNRNNKKDKKIIDVIIGDIPILSGVIDLVHSCITWATTAITPIMEDITVTIKPRIINTEANHPMCRLMLYIMVVPVTIVILLMAINNMNVKKQERKSAQVNDIPYLAPATTMEVTLPVPITYPTINRPGKIDNKKLLIFIVFIIHNEDKS